MNKKEGYKDFWKYFYSWCYGCGIDPKEARQKEAGVYMLYQEKQLQYIGKTDWRYKRLFEHSSVNNSNKYLLWDHHSFIPIEDPILRTLTEKILIHILQPPLNKVRPTIQHLIEAEQSTLK